MAGKEVAAMRPIEIPALSPEAVAELDGLYRSTLYYEGSSVTM